MEMNVPLLFARADREQAKLPINHRVRIVAQKPYPMENHARGSDQLPGIQSAI